MILPKRISSWLKVGVYLFGGVILCYGLIFLLLPGLQRLPETKAIDVAGGSQFGKWMLTGNQEIASWLGQPYQGKTIQEPINIILIDAVAASPEEAIRHLYESCEAAKYLSRKGHSSEYLADIGGRIYRQIPSEPDHAFSTAPYIFPSNHGRIFGPHQQQSQYYFIGALSREGINIFARIKHSYVSFEAAKQDFAARLQENSDYKVQGKYDMQNSLQGSKAFTSGDHDGTAIVLIRKPK